MKRKILAIVFSIVLSLATLSACGSKNTASSVSENTSTQTTVSDDTSASIIVSEDETKASSEAGTETSSDTSVSEDSEADEKGSDVSNLTEQENLYKSVLENVIEVIQKDDWQDIGDGEIGILELVNYTDDPYASLGYVIDDFSGDGKPELLILSLDTGLDKPVGKEILAGYTLVNNKAQFVFEGYNRSAVYYMGGNKFLSEGSAGALYTIYGVHSLSNDGTMLNVDDYYFTYEHDDTYESLDYYHNTSGEFDPSKSEKLDMDDAEFTELMTKLWSEVKSFDNVKTISEYLEETGRGNLPKAAKVYTYYYEDVEHVYSSFDKHTVDEGMYETEVVIAFSKDVTDFTFFGAVITGYTADSKPVFDRSDFYTVKKVSSGVPEKITLVFRGDSPSYGFSYVDGDGQTKVYLIDVSGMDGSLITIDAN